LPAIATFLPFLATSDILLVIGEMFGLYLLPKMFKGDIHVLYMLAKDIYFISEPKEGCKIFGVSCLIWWLHVVYVAH
jgi:hypothetical protein